MSLLLALTLMTDTAEASCGLEHCAPDTLDRGQAMTRARVTTADGGWYSETFVGGNLRLGRVRIAALVPTVTVSDGHGTQVGLGNAVAGAEVETPWPVRLGLQGELPTATDSAFGDAHALLLPYARLQYAGAVTVNAQVGWARQVDGGGHHHHHHHGHDHGLQLNPHTASELLGRVVLSRPVWRVEPGLGVDVVHELVDQRQTPVTGLVTLAAGQERLRVQTQLQVPLTDARRNDLRGVVGVTVGF